MYCFNRFNTLFNNWLPNGGCKLYSFIDWFFSFIISGASFYDYFAYGFREKSMIGRKSFVTWRKHKLIQKKFNNIHFIKYFRDKSLFNIIFCDFLGRQSFKLSDISCEDFGKLVLQNKELFIKDVNGYCGHGIAVVKCRDINYVDFYKMFDSKESQNILVETLINQNRVLSSLHPFSINTIRVTTIYDQNKDKLYLMNARH